MWSHPRCVLTGRQMGAQFGNENWTTWRPQSQLMVGWVARCWISGVLPVKTEVKRLMNWCFRPFCIRNLSVYSYLSCPGRTGDGKRWDTEVLFIKTYDDSMIWAVLTVDIHYVICCWSGRKTSKELLETIDRRNLLNTSNALQGACAKHKYMFMWLCWCDGDYRRWSWHSDQSFW